MKIGCQHKDMVHNHAATPTTHPKYHVISLHLVPPRLELMNVMELDRCIYECIVGVLDQLIHSNDCLQQLITQFPDVPQQTLLSIYSQHYQLVTKQTHGLHRKPETVQAYQERYWKYRREEKDEGKELLLKMASQVQLSPVLLARIILEQVITEDSELNTTAAVPRELVSQWVREPHLIPDPVLQLQVKHCIVNDTNYGPLAENLKHSIGYEHEFLLQEQLQELGIPFMDEHSLRGRGYDKTPDFKLEIPIAVDGYIINWVESKASFGDDHSHSQYLEEQFWSYQNRFGSGAVIYWKGFISDLDCHRDQGIALLSTFPSKDSIQTIKYYS